MEWSKLDQNHPFEESSLFVPHMTCRKRRTTHCTENSRITIKTLNEVRTSDSLNEGLPIKMARKKFHGKR